jgi:hypothetical protein
LSIPGIASTGGAGYAVLDSVVRVKRCVVRRAVERTVEIVEEPGRAYKWFAIDQATRQSLLRLPDLNQLRDVCHRLGWKVVDVKRAPGIGTTVARQRSTRSQETNKGLAWVQREE